MIKPKIPPYITTAKDPDSTRADIDRLLQAYGIAQVQWTVDWRQNIVILRFMIEAEIEGVRKELGIEIIPPLFLSKRRTWNPTRGRYEKVNAPNWAQSMRCLYWYLKAKIEGIAYGMTTSEQEFLSQVIVNLPSGQPTPLINVMRPMIVADRLSSIPALTEKVNPNEE